MSPWVFWLFVILLIGSGSATDVPFVFDETALGVADYSSSQLEQAHIASSDLAGVPAVTPVAEDEVLDFPITGGGNAPNGTTEKRVSDLKIEFDARVEPENSRVNDEALWLALKYPGDLPIDQIASIYGYLKNGDDSKKGWGYVRDPRGIDYLRYANATLRAGDRSNCVGGGDCDDFAILMAALVESVGGTTRIILARNNTTGGHAYTEVYIGQINATGSQVEPIIDWLKGKFNTGKIYTHIDTDTKDVWLNLDWGPDEKGNTHPGGPFFQGDKHIVLCIRDRFVKTPLNLPEAFRETTQVSQSSFEVPENQPPVLTGLRADKVSPQGAETSMTWAAEANDPDGDPILYRFFLNGWPVTDYITTNVWSTCASGGEFVCENRTSPIEGQNLIEIRVRDGKHSPEDGFDDKRSATFVISAANQLPVINRLVSDKDSPKEAGTTVTWTAEASDPENDLLLYRFLIRGNIVSQWSTDSSWTWSTTQDDVGDNQVEVQVRDDKHEDIDSYDGHKAVSFTITAPPPVIKSTAAEDEDLIRTIEERTDLNNSVVLNKVALLAAKYPGDFTIDQICSIYSYLKYGDSTTRGWSYISDPRGQDHFRYANETLNLAEEVGSSGVGDCGDFAILVSDIIVSIGGTSRIILAQNNSTGGHAYAEVYLGNLNDPSNQVEDIIGWLRQEYDTDNIYTHIDNYTKDVWLNLDWGSDERGDAHPGGPFFRGDKHIVLSLRDEFIKTPLRLPEQTTQVIQSSSGIEVVFPDPNLDAAIRAAINKPEGVIYTADLENIIVFDAHETGIKNTKGLEYCNNLEELYLYNNQITDVSPLSGLINLKTLYLGRNQITDVSPLSGLTNLQELILGGNQITDVSPLSGLTNLRDLSLTENQIIDISPLSGLVNLSWLNLDSNQISDVSPLSGLINLKTLYLGRNQITDVSPLSRLTNLQELALEGNQITDFSSLSGLTCEVIK
jgi:transglutaminase-like putative cysteine protease